MSVLAATGCGAGPKPTATPTAVASPLDLVSRDALFATLTDLTAIRPYAGWRNSGTEGEREALDYVARRMEGFAALKALGLEVERDEFSVFMATEMWASKLVLRVDGGDHEVPVSAIRGSRDVITQAVHFDSDGRLNDTDRNPVNVEGGVRVLRTPAELSAWSAGDVAGKLVFADYALFDTVTVSPSSAAVKRAEELLRLHPAGVVLVTHYSNAFGESHGTFAGEGGGALGRVDVEPFPPVLFVRLEDLAPAGLKTWTDLVRIESARLTWDADVLSPARSGNVVARLPGADSSQAIILGAHVDSPNNPGAMDDGSGVAVLLEVARTFDAAQLRPAVDVYFAFFGSEELGLYGSHVFAETHQDLLDRTLAMLQIDCLSRPIEQVRDMKLTLGTWSYERQGDRQLAWPFYLKDALARQGIDVLPQDVQAADSDNTSFAGFDVPNANLAYFDEEQMWAFGGVHYAGHLHDPYDTVDLARESGDRLEQLARGAAQAVLQVGQERPVLRVTDPPKGRVVIVASHTEAVHVSPAEFTDFGMTLAWQGLDVDVVPYGRAVTPADLAGAAMVVVLPVLDYPSALAGSLGAYDEAWTEAEVAALDDYAARGGFLVLTNAAYRLKHANRPMIDANEDWPDMNALAARFGVTYVEGRFDRPRVDLSAGVPFLRGVSTLELAAGDAVPFTSERGTVLARADAGALAALIDYQDGQVLALADVGIFGGDAQWGDPYNLLFWQRLADYVLAR